MRPFLTRLSSESRTKSVWSVRIFSSTSSIDFVEALACVDEVMNHQREIGFMEQALAVKDVDFLVRCFFQSKITSNHGGIVRAGELG